jgi:hypothetical protein
VVEVTVADDVDLTVRVNIANAASYVKFGRVFLFTSTGSTSGTCYGCVLVLHYHSSSVSGACWRARNWADCGFGFNLGRHEIQSLPNIFA